MKHTALLLAVLAVLASPLHAADTLHVSADPSSGGDGQSWLASIPLATALQQAQAGDQIWMRSGVYSVDPATMPMPRGVRVYGGFAGDERLREHRDWFRRPTVITLQAAWRWANHDSTTRIDGILFRGPSGSIEIEGGQPAFYNCRFTNFDATPITARNVGRLRFEFCVFDHNRSRAVHINDIVDTPSYGYGPFFGQTLFWSNRTEGKGAGIAIESTKSNAFVQVVSCVFDSNTAQAGGGAIWAASHTYVTNSTFIRNYAGEAAPAARGHVLWVQRPMYLQNSILWNGNVSEPQRLIYADTSFMRTPVEAVGNLVESDFEFGYWTINPDVVNINDVLGPDGFFGTDDDGLRPSSQSVALDAGVIDRFVNHNNTDAVGNPRLVGRRIEMGAYEQQREGRLSPKEVMTEMQRGGLLFVFRHAKTDWGEKDRGPSPECFPGRNLILEGREQSHEIGASMVANSIPIGDSWSSPVCRCWETLKVMVGRYEVKGYWAHGDGSAIVQQRWADVKTIPTGGNRVISTHDAVVQSVFNPTLAGFDITTAEFMEGDCLILRPTGDTAAILAQWCSDTWERYRVRFPEVAVSVPMDLQDAASMHVWPNPAADHVTIKVATPQHVVLTDLLGRSVWSGWINDQHVVALSDTTGGMYMVRGAKSGGVLLQVGLSD